MVSWTASEIKLLLTLIQEREALYDIANEDYTNRDIVWALWTDIAKQLNKSPCREKWTSLRCIYRRIVNQQANSNKKKKIKWPWANMMTFLIPHIKTIQPRYGPDVDIDDADSVITITDHKAYGTHDNHLMTLSNYSEDYELEEGVINPEDGVAEYLYDESGAESEPVEDHRMKNPSVKRIKLEDPVHLSQLNTRHKKDIKSERTNGHSNCRTENVDEFLKLIQSSHKMPSTPAVQPYDQLIGVDPDEMFFRSIVPDVKLLNQRDKGAFKLRVQQMLYDMLYPSREDEQDTVTQNNP
ncbi:hypothetical protein B7P43_G10856 [Cryptotermes secundus]|uniref:MADF domain-containing protein n=1 Tax=Cryptotermes secundus TaxID=105785 RepID=A0A2J7Q218_9NEOP|nr:uncharacterized protein LOC111870356 isoform X2 [Cryptotermes secundus]PNF22619.1 hypothetical protein B7P43_G10856 [Cryptotermes secundus]